MVNIILTMLLVSMFWRLFSKRFVLQSVCNTPEQKALNLSDTSLLSLFSKVPDAENSPELNGDKNENVHSEQQPQRYRSSYGEKFEYVKYMLAEKINELVVYQKRFIDPTFSLIDCANEVGFNRSYVSRAINEEYNKNFNSLINDHRYLLLCQTVRQHPRLTREEYAIRSGFNSITTMMRVIKLKSGLNYREWKLRLLAIQ